MIGTLQATEVLKVLLGIGSTLSGRVLCYDALNMTFREFNLHSTPDAKTIEKLTDYVLFCNGNTPFVRLDVNEVANRRNQGWRPFVLDVRTPSEFNASHLVFFNMRKTLEELNDALETLPRDQDILCHCKHGPRAVKALKLLADNGFVRLFHMQGGIEHWKTQIRTGVVWETEP